MLDTLYLSIYEWTIQQSDIQSVYAKLVEPKRLMFLMLVDDISFYSKQTIPGMVKCVMSSLDDLPHQLELTCLHEKLGYAKIIFTQSLEKSLDESWVLLSDRQHSKNPLTYVDWMVAYNHLNVMKNDIVLEQIHRFYLGCYYLAITYRHQHFYAMKQLEISLLSPAFQWLTLTHEQRHQLLLLQQDYDYKNSTQRLLGYMDLFENVVVIPPKDLLIQTCKEYILIRLDEQ